MTETEGKAQREDRLGWEALGALLGGLTSAPVPLTGGHLHRMFTVETGAGKYAVKALNPSVMKRPEARGNFLRSEAFARRARENGIPALPALLFDGSPLIETEGRFWMIFPWHEGNPLYGNDIAPEMCEKMGEVLARIHALTEPFRQPGEEHPDTQDWARYLRLAEEQGAPWKDAVSLDRLNEWSERWNRFRRMEKLCTVSHRDFEPKNVLWLGGDPTVIDWEAAGSVSLAADVAEGMRCWSRMGESRDPDKSEAFLEGYRRTAGEERFRLLDLSSAEDARFGFTEWLAYSMERSLGLAAEDEAERKLGTEQVWQTLAENRE